IWSMDTFGSQLVVTPGDPSSNSTQNLYFWANNDVTVAPTLLSNAPAGVKWVFVSNGAICTLGSQGILNQFYSSDIANSNSWTPGPATYAFKTTIEQANPLISQASVRNKDLLFTEYEVYINEFIDKPFIWNTRKLLTTDGIMGPKARAVAQDRVFWMGKGDFFMFDGTSAVDIIPNCTVKRHVFDNINIAQAYKTFAWVNIDFNECWFFYCAGSDTEPNNYVKVNYKEWCWDVGTL